MVVKGALQKALVILEKLVLHISCKWLIVVCSWVYDE